MFVKMALLFKMNAAWLQLITLLTQFCMHVTAGKWFHIWVRWMIIKHIKLQPIVNTKRCKIVLHESLDRYANMWVAHAPGMPGTLSPPPRVSDPDIHHGTCVTHVTWCMPGSLISGLLWRRWRGKRYRHFWRNFAYLSRGPCWTSIK